MNRDDILKQFLAQKAFSANDNYYGKALLPLAVQYDAVDTAKTLLDAGADLNIPDMWGMSPLGEAQLRHKTEMANLFLEHGAMENIFDAVYLNDLATVKKLLAQNKSLALTTNKNNCTLAEIAAATGRGKILELLLDKGAPLDLPGGTTLLHIAAAYNQTNVVELLIQKGVELDAMDKQGFTPLHLAAGQNSQESAALLLKHRLLKHAANPNAGTVPPKNGRPQNMPYLPNISAGSTPLHIAALYGETNMIALLLKSGASINATNEAGMTPLDIASRPGFYGAPFAFGIINGFAIVPMDLLPERYRPHGFSPLKRADAAAFLQEAGAKHGENYPQNGMPFYQRASIQSPAARLAH